MIVEGAIIDRDGIRSGYVRFRGSRVVEVGKTGTDSTRGRERRVRGIVVPPAVDGHTHLGDAAWTREPPDVPVDRLVAPPHGVKFQVLRDTPARRKRSAIRQSLVRLAREGTSRVIDFREEGLEGVRLLREAAEGLAIRPVVLGRTLRRPVDPRELAALLRLADGVGLSSARDEPRAARSASARACRAGHKLFALHASEVVREDPDDFLNPRPNLVVHLLKATPADIEQVVGEGVSVAVCPRSNALFHRRPPLDTLERLGASTLLGTDNVMLQSPSMLRELEFAYLSARQARHPVSPEFLVRAAFIEPWTFLSEPSRAVIGPEGSGVPLVFRLPPEDPAYQLVTRATEHLIWRPGSRGA